MEFAGLEPGVSSDQIQKQQLQYIHVELMLLVAASLLGHVPPPSSGAMEQSEIGVAARRAGSGGRGPFAGVRRLAGQLR